MYRLSAARADPAVGCTWEGALSDWLQVGEMLFYDVWRGSGPAESVALSVAINPGHGQRQLPCDPIAGT